MISTEGFDLKNTNDLNFFKPRSLIGGISLDLILLIFGLYP